MHSANSCKVFVYGLLRFRLLVFFIIWRFPSRIPYTLYGYSKQGVIGHNLTIVSDQQSHVVGFILYISQSELQVFDKFEKIDAKYIRTQINVDEQNIWIYTLMSGEN